MRFDGSMSENLWAENGRLHRHFGQNFLNFDARSILSTKKDAHWIGESTIKNSTKAM